MLILIGPSLDHLTGDNSVHRNYKRLEINFAGLKQLFMRLKNTGGTGQYNSGLGSQSLQDMLDFSVAGVQVALLQYSRGGRMAS